MRVLCAVLVVVAAVGVGTRDLQIVYLPLVVRRSYEMAGYWDVIVPEATVNYVLNPSFEENVTDGWSNYSTGTAGGTRTRSSTQAKFGAYALELVKNAGAESDRWGLRQTLDNSVSGQSYIAAAWVYVGAGCTVTLWIDKVAGAGAAQAVSASHSSPTGEWTRIETAALTANATGDAMYVYVWATGTPTVTGYVDAVQLEHKAYITTYCDGDQPGCEWTGTEHASSSQRSGQSRAGGRIRSLRDDYSFYVSAVVGLGMPALRRHVHRYAFLPGGESGGYKAEPRSFSIVGSFVGSSMSDLHSQRQALLEVLSPDYVAGDQAVRLRYSGATVEKEVGARYEGGLELDLRAEEGWNEDVAVRFLATDPFFYEVGESAAVLDSNDSATLRYVAGRLKSTGQWDDLGLTANPTTNGEILAIARHPDGSVYFGGDFTGMNGVAGRDYIARYIPATDTWETVGAGSALNGDVRAMAIAANGDVYVGGSFTNVGDANGDYVAYWDGTSWHSVSGGGTGTVEALTFGLDAKLYVGGNYTNWNGLADGDRIVSWDGSAYAALGTGMNGIVEALVTGLNGDIYAAGSFTTAGGTTVNYVAKWNGSAWSALGTGLNSAGYVLAVAEGGNIYVGGAFTTADGNSANRIAEWNGQTFVTLGSGTNAEVRAIALGPDGKVFTAGDFSSAGGIDLADRVAMWNGSSWAHLDVNLPAGVTSVNALAVGSADSEIGGNYDLYLGTSNTGLGYFAGSATVTNDGTETEYPIIVIKRSGGTAAFLESVRNETTGKELLFDYRLLDGEELVIDTRPMAKSIVSDYFGNRPDAILRGSDFGAFALQRGENQVTCFVDVAGGPTVEAYVIWRDAYWSLD